VISKECDVNSGKRKTFVPAIGACVLLIVSFPLNAAGTQVDSAGLDTAFQTLRTYEWGPQRDALVPIDQAAAQCHSNPDLRKDLETRLIAILKSDANMAAKGYACEVLATIGTANSVPALADLLTNEEMSHSSRRALAAIRDPAALRSLRTALPQLPDKLKLGVVQTLGNLHDKAAVDALIPLLESENDDLVGAAAEALARLGENKADEAVLNHYQQGTPASKQLIEDACLGIAQRRLSAQQWESAADVYHLLEDSQQIQVKWAAFQGLVAAEPAKAQTRLVDALAGEMTSNSQQLRMVGQLIRQSVRDDNVASLAASISELPETSQMVMLDALGSVKHPAVRQAALGCVKSQLTDLRVMAEQTLAKCGTAEDLSLLAGIAASSRDQREQNVAMQALQKISGPEVDDTLLTMVRESPPALQKVLIRTIASRKTSGSGDTLVKLAQSDDASVRLEAYRALQVVADPNLTEQLVDLLAKTPKGKEREAADRAVWRSVQQVEDQNRRADALLTKIKNAPNSEKLALLPALGRLGGEEALPVVQDAIQSRSADLREAGIRALTNWPDASVADQLWEIASNDQNRSHRIWALRAFARVLPQQAREQPDQVAAQLQAAMEAAGREEDKRLILSRLPAVRSEQALNLAMSCLLDVALRADAIEVTAELGEAMKESHPPAARKALETVAGMTDNPALAMHIQKILWNMELKGH
jgi:HEAT repeat protein